MRQEGEKTHTTEKSGSVLLFVSIELQLSDVIGLSHVCLFQQGLFKGKSRFLLLYLCVWMVYIGLPPFCC